MRRRLFTRLAAVSVLLTAAACGSSDGGDTSDAGASSGGVTTVEVGLIPIVDVAPLYLGQKKGFFEKQGLKLEFTAAQGGAAVVPGVASGQFQFGFSNVTSLMIAQSNNVPIKAVANAIASTVSRARTSARSPWARTVRSGRRRTWRASGSPSTL
ncbi:hypothetical protein SVIOM74S_01828 [Streptomyces violarus]